mgnify:CR=1 FL=1
MNLHETAMGQRFFNVQLPALINTLKDIAAALSRPAPSAISFPADQHFLTSLYYGEYEADVFKPDKRLAPFNQAVQQKEKALLPLLSSEGKARSLLRDKVTEEEIARIIERWTGIPVARLMEGEREKLLHLEDILHKRVVGQDELAALLRRLCNDLGGDVQGHQHFPK